MTTTTEEAFDDPSRLTPATGTARLFPRPATSAAVMPHPLLAGAAAVAPASSELARTAAVPIRETIRNAREPGSPSTPTLKTRIPGVLSLRDGRQTTSHRGAHPQGGQAVTLRNMRKGRIPATHESVKTFQITKLPVRQRRLHFGATSAIMAP